MGIMSKKNLPVYLVPILVSALVLVLAVTGVLSGWDKALYDGLLGFKASGPVSNRIVLLDVDDIAIAKAGTWPWPRTACSWPCWSECRSPI